VTAKLGAALGAVDWNLNVKNLCSSVSIANRIEDCNFRLAVWARQLELIEAANPAVAFVREMQHGGHNVACTLALALYKPAAASMRAIVECALYYSFFRSHLEELGTLVRDPKFYVAKKEILAFFSKHVQGFSERQAVLGYLQRLDGWYSKTSSIVHGQIPGTWSNGTDVSGIAHDNQILAMAVGHFEAAVGLVQDTFICVMPWTWGVMESQAKAVFTKGMSGRVKAALGLDMA